MELYPTLEVLPATAKTATFLAHAAVPIGFTEEDFEQVAAGNFVVKVIYLPDPAFQDLAATGPDEVVSSRLEPGVDPIIEAKRRGSILAIVRLGNIDLEAPNTPGMDAPAPGAAPKPPVPYPMPRPGMPLPPGAMGMMPPGVPPGLMPPGMTPPGMLPPGMMPPGMMPPGMTPTMPGPGGPAPSTVPTTTPAPGTPVSKSSSSSTLLPAGFPWMGR